MCWRRDRGGNAETDVAERDDGLRSTTPWPPRRADGAANRAAPNAPSSAPSVDRPPAISSFAITGISDITALAPIPNTAPRSSTRAIAGDIAM